MGEYFMTRIPPRRRSSNQAMERTADRRTLHF
jgi:hypothetical protein